MVETLFEARFGMCDHHGVRSSNTSWFVFQKNYLYAYEKCHFWLDVYEGDSDLSYGLHSSSTFDFRYPTPRCIFEPFSIYGVWVWEVEGGS